MKKLNKKKGFTIVELVIVIAVVGVLTAVLVPTFVNLANQAKRAENQTFVKNLNTQMGILENDPDHKAKDEKTGEEIVIGGRNVSMYDAIVDATEIGHNVERLTPVDGNDIIWDSVANRFAIVTSDFNPDSPEEKKIVYSDGGLKGKGAQLWKMYSSMPSKQSYSIYAKEGWDMSAIGETVFTVGFDAGRNAIPDGQTVKYERQPSSSTIRESVAGKSPRMLAQGGQEVTIRTNGGSLSVNAPADDVRHAGKAASVDVAKSSTYNEYGKVGFGQIAEGHYVAHDGSETNVLLATGDGDKVTIDNNGGKIGKAYTTDESSKQTLHGGNTSLDYFEPSYPEGATESEKAAVLKEAIASLETGATLFAGGTGTESDPFLIADYDTFQHVSMFDWYGVALEYYYDGHSWSDSMAFADENALSADYGKINYFKVKPGITEIDCANWKPVYLYGCIDGSNVTLKNLDKNLFQEAYAYDSDTDSYKECLIENFNVEVNISSSGAASAIAQSAGPIIKFKNVNVSGKIEGNYVGSYFTFGAGQFESDSNHNPTIAGQYTFENCTSSATLQCNSIGEGGAGGFIHHPYGAAGTTITIKDSKYTGTMYVFSGKNHGYVSCFDATTVVFDYSEGFEQGTYTTKDANKANSSNYEYPAPNYVSVSGSKHGQLSNYDVIEINAVPNASYATATLFIAPNPGALLYPALQETLTLENGKFTTITVRKYDITWNGEIRDVITGNNYEVGGNGAFTGINGSYIIINQYSSDGTLLSSDQYTVSGKLGN